VFKATSGIKALEVLDTQGEMAVIISDQRMPKMTGTEFLSRTVETFPDTIRIVLTGYTDVEDLVDAINAGKVFKYITKPWNPKQLKGVVEQAAETYKVLKQRTNTLTRALQRESLFNSVMTAIRGSLDYRSMLQTVVETLGNAFTADYAVLYPIEVLDNSQAKLPSPVELPDPNDSFIYQQTTGQAIAEQVQQYFRLEGTPQIALSQEMLLETMDFQEQPITRLVVPFIAHQAILAMMVLYQQGNGQSWSQSTLDLFGSVSEQVALAISQAKLHQCIQKQTEQMRTELEVARQIQSNLLHQSWPETPGIKIQARCQPARQVGGDFFEVFVHPQGDIWLAVGDVSGKGVPAALFMASAISVLRRELSQETSPNPDVVMSNLNQSLADDLISNNCFITMALVCYTPSNRRLLYANAGHVYPLVWSQRALISAHGSVPASGVEPSYLDVRGVPLGILPDWRAACGELTLDPGDVVLLTSDGITEATVTLANHSLGNTMLKQEGLWQLLQAQTDGLDLDNLLSYLYTPDGEQEDDQTILSLEVI
jgi:serine phosphatase RsbU (regulator of sigma subunit)